jgi:hypothetical protein
LGALKKGNIMEKKYIKPEIAIDIVEAESMLCLSAFDESATGNEVLGKRRGGGSYSSFTEEEEEWVKETDMWGNECWTRTR